MNTRTEPIGRGLLYNLYQKRLRRALTPQMMPHHVGMIIDGNRRWAKQLGYQTAAHGHRAGAAKMREFLTWCDDLGIDVVTLYLLSADNLAHRASDEIKDLLEIIADLADDVSRFRDWRVKHVGNSNCLPEQLIQSLEAAEHRTEGKKGLHINLAVGYGGRTEIVDAMRKIVREHEIEGRSLEELADMLTPDMIGEHLYTGGQPDPDLVIRTSGEQRLSDFMLWQSAHSEFYFVEALGPDLREVDFLRALRDYVGRSRRFGG
ncbi:isoprenyl transferase [Paramicrobacterium fandaimingii]|uniref:isoprenyl transferase n=1 Tax=Paramicrobacterium fandaimingii TaxID=2708079 RepID=UPI001421687E|nr:isoprenyl transferase [Microbacterium fandaimingii]